jgi:hypothetical protein
VGAQLSRGAGPISGLYDVEQQLSRIDGLNLVHLRAAYFMENFFFGLDLIRSQGIIGTPLRGDLPIPMIATRDIAQVAAELLLQLDFSGHLTKELLGQRDISMHEATRIISKAIGKEGLAYVQFPYEQAEQAMLAMGISLDVSRSLNEMDQALNEERAAARPFRLIRLDLIRQFAESSPRCIGAGKVRKPLELELNLMLAKLRGPRRAQAYSRSDRGDESAAVGLQ